MLVETAPQALVDVNGRIQTGIYARPIERLNCLDFRLPGTNKTVSPSRIKRWEYIGIASDEFIIGGAVVSLHYLGNVFFYIFDRRRKVLKEKSFLAPLCRGIGFSSNGASGRIFFEKGKYRIFIENDRKAGVHRLELTGVGFELNAELAQAPEPLVFASRVGYKGFNYTLKEAGLPVGGVLKVAGEKRDLGTAESFGVIDFTTGCLARETFWNWASGGGHDVEGNRIGINLVQGVNETGVTENAFWVNDTLVKTDTLTFAYDDLNVLKPWRIRSWDGKVDLMFTPEGERFENTDLKLITSKFHQPFGSFAGTLISDDGKKHIIEKMAGYTEEHFARW